MAAANSNNDLKLDAHPPAATSDADERIEVASRKSLDDDIEKPAEEKRLQLKSELDSLGIWKTLWKFKKVSLTRQSPCIQHTRLHSPMQAVFLCTVLCWAAAADGYQINLNGGIIANLGFTRHMGHQKADGSKLQVTKGMSAVSLTQR